MKKDEIIWAYPKQGIGNKPKKMKKDEIIWAYPKQGIGNKPKNDVFQLEVNIFIC